MATKTYDDAVSSFESTFQDKYELPYGLVEQFFLDALSQYELEMGETRYDEDSQEFPADFKQYQIMTIAYLMKVKYCERELSRVNKIMNIIGKDISMNDSGGAKRATKEELELELNRANDFLNKQKTTAYA
jgi:hypothetical protein